MDKKVILEELYVIALKNKELHQFIMRELERLNIVLFNLKIEGAKLSEANGIGVIANELRKINKRIKNEVRKSKQDEQHIAELFEILNGDVKKGE